MATRCRWMSTASLPRPARARSSCGTRSRPSCAPPARGAARPRSGPTCCSSKFPRIWNSPAFRRRARTSCAPWRRSRTERASHPPQRASGSEPRHNLHRDLGSIGHRGWNFPRCMRLPSNPNLHEENAMRIFTPALVAAALVVTGAAIAPLPARAAETLSSVPSNSFTVTKYYKQDVYDKSDQKIGQILDVLMTDDGKITGFVIGAGGFLGMGRHDVIVPASAVSATKKNSKTYLVMDTTKDALKPAPGFKYDRTAETWVRDDRTTEGSSRGDRVRSKKE